MKSEYEQSRNEEIDFLRLIASFLVVCLHTKFPSSTLAPYMASVGKSAVPFFLTVSGFYLWRADRNIQAQALLQTSKRILLGLLPKVLIIYISFQLFVYVCVPDSFSSRTIWWAGILLLNDADFWEHLWYLPAFGYALLALVQIVRIREERWIASILLILLFANYAAGTWSRLNIEQSHRAAVEFNWISYGVPFVLLGMVLRRCSDTIPRISGAAYLVVIVITVAGIMLEHKLYKHFLGHGPGVVFASLLPMVLVSFCVQVRYVSKSSLLGWLSMLGARYSLGIYLYHVLVRDALEIMVPAINNSIVVFMFSLIGTWSYYRLRDSISRPVSLT